MPVNYNGWEPSPFLLSSSRIMEGEGWMVVLAVGKNSFSGKIKSSIVQEEDETILQQRLSIIGDKIGGIVIKVSLLILGFLIVYQVIDCFQS